MLNRLVKTKDRFTFVLTNLNYCYTCTIIFNGETRKLCGGNICR